MGAAMVPGIILAAGQSSRMGRPKALLPASPQGPTFVARLARTLLEGGTADVLVVGRGGDDALRREVDALGPGIRFVANLDADRGQLSSVIAGLNAADRPGVTAILVAPVDAPYVAPSTVAALLAHYSTSRAPVIRATYRGRHGHPVVFGRSLFDELRRADPSQGAKAVVRAHAAAIVDLDSDDAAVVHDIDAPDDRDYARMLETPSAKPT
jgi:CTP:molybdopterin cytidylyltransferase MocA